MIEVIKKRIEVNTWKSPLFISVPLPMKVSYDPVTSPANIKPIPQAVAVYTYVMPSKNGNSIYEFDYVEIR